MQVVCTSAMAHRALAETSHCVSFGMHRGTCRKSSDKTDTLTQYIITIESQLPWCETSEQGLLSFALLVFEWTQNAKDLLDTMLFKSKLEGQVSLDRHTSHLLAFRSCCQDDKIHCCGLLTNHVEIKADVNARVFSRILNGAFGVSALHHPTQLKMVFLWNLTF